MFAAAAALVVAVLVLPWTPWPGGEFGHAPWWVWGPLVAAVVLLLLGAGERRYTAWATAVAGVALVAGVATFLAWPADEVVVDGRSHEWIRANPLDVPSEWLLRLYPAEPPAAPLAGALVAAAVLVLGVVMLVRRSEPWTAPAVEPGSDLVDGEVRDQFRPVRRVMAAGLVGVLVGGLLGVGTAYGAGELRRERMEALGPWWGPLAESVPVPEDRLHEGAVEWDADRRDFVEQVPVRPARVAWQRDFAGPVALSTCVLDGRARATVVALEESGERSMIVGYDARDGAPRWSLTVHRRDTAQLTQVAVGEGCHVLVLIGTVLLAVDTYTGEVAGSSVLPAADRGAWHFMTSAPGEYPRPRLVGVRASQYAFLTAPNHRIFAVRRSDATLVGVSGPRTWGGCTALAVYHDDREMPGALLLDPCSDRAAVAWVPELASPEELRAPRPPAYRRPPLQPLRAGSERPVPAAPPGCSRGSLRIWSGGALAVVEAKMDCAGTQRRARVQLRHDDFVAGDEEWEMAPEADAVPDLTVVRSGSRDDLLEVRGDAVTMLGSARFDPWWSVVPQPGDPVVGLADVDPYHSITHRLDGPEGLTAAGLYSPVLALTRSGTLVDLAEFRYGEAPEPVRVLATSDVARQPCSGERGLLLDKASGTALVSCTANGRAHVTAVTA